MCIRSFQKSQIIACREKYSKNQNFWAIQPEFDKAQWNDSKHVLKLNLLNLKVCQIWSWICFEFEKNIFLKFWIYIHTYSAVSQSLFKFGQKGWNCLKGICFPQAKLFVVKVVKLKKHPVDDCSVHKMGWRELCPVEWRMTAQHKKKPILTGQEIQMTLANHYNRLLTTCIALALWPKPILLERGIGTVL